MAEVPCLDHAGGVSQEAIEEFRWDLVFGHEPHGSVIEVFVIGESRAWESFVGA